MYPFAMNRHAIFPYPLKQHAGFTLIELVVVIALLGVLAATALPRFISTQKESRTAAMRAIAGNASSAFALVYAKATLQNVQTQASASVFMEDGTTVQLKYGYPTLLSVLNVLPIAPLSGFSLVPLSAASGYIAPAGVANDATCRLVFTEATGASSPATIQALLSDCS